MTHWREHIGSPLLGAYSLYDDATDSFIEKEGLILDVKKAEYVLGASGKKLISIANTTLGKPLKINVTIAKVLAFITRSGSIEKWVNVPVIFYVDRNVNSKDGVVDAIRVKPAPPAVKVDYSLQEKMLRECKDIDSLTIVYTGFTPDQKLGTKAVASEMGKILKPETV